MIGAESIPPILKAVRDLDAVDLALVIKLASLLPRLRSTNAGATIEIKSVRREGWVVNEIHRERLEVL